MTSFWIRIRRHWADPRSHHRRIARDFLWVSFFVAVGKLAGIAKEMAIAQRYGISETVDAYVFIFNLVNWPVSVWFSVLTVVLLPLIAKIRIENPSSLQLFRGELLGMTLVMGLVLTVVAYVMALHALDAGWFGLSDASLKEAQKMVGPLGLLIPMGMVISLFSAWLMANGHHRNTLFEALPALVILGALLLPPGWIPEPLIWGTIAGFALQMAGLGWPLWRTGDLQRPALGFRSSAWRGFWGGFGIMAAGQALMSLTGIIDQFFAARLGTGAISVLSYANRIVALILALGATAISRSTLPIFSDLIAQGRTLETRALTLRWAKWMFMLGVLVATVAWWLSPWLVAMLFERGAFTAEDTLAVSELQRYLLLQLPFYFCGMVFVSFFSAQNRYGTIQIVASLNLVAKVLALFLLTPMLGVEGIALSTTVTYAISSTLLFIALKRLNY